MALIEVCVDANFAIRMVTKEVGSDLAWAHFEAWLREDVGRIAPSLFHFENHSALRKKVKSGELSDAGARDAWNRLRRLRVRTVRPRGLWDRAWEIATALDRRVTYDSTYIACAELRGCELYTGDKRLFNSARAFPGGRFDFVRSA